MELLKKQLSLKDCFNILWIICKKIIFLFSFFIVASPVFVGLLLFSIVFIPLFIVFILEPLGYSPEKLDIGIMIISFAVTLYIIFPLCFPDFWD